MEQVCASSGNGQCDDVGVASRSCALFNKMLCARDTPLIQSQSPAATAAAPDTYAYRTIVPGDLVTATTRSSSFVVVVVVVVRPRLTGLSRRHRNSVRVRAPRGTPSLATNDINISQTSAARQLGRIFFRGYIGSGVADIC